MADITYPELGMQFKTPENAETPLVNKKTWLGAGLEVGGAIFFDISDVKSGEKTLTYAYPLVTIGHNDIKKAKILQDAFGGFVTKRSDKNSWYWTIKGANAAKLLSDLKPSTPSRQEVIEVMESWSQAGSREERLGIAHEFQPEQMKKPVTPERYEKLLEDPNFVAGVIENRGSVYQHERYFADKGVGNVTSGLEIHSTNKELLLAFSRKFGGKLYVVKSAGEVQNIKGDQVTLQNDSVVLKLGQDDMSKIIPIVQPYLLFVWDVEAA